MGCKTISGTLDDFSVVATEAETLKLQTLTSFTGLKADCFRCKEEEPKNWDLKEMEFVSLGMLGFERLEMIWVLW